MGLQNCLYTKNVPFASTEAQTLMMSLWRPFLSMPTRHLVTWPRSVAHTRPTKAQSGISDDAYDSLALLEEERGMPAEVRGGRMDWAGLRDKISKQGMRNSNVLAIAPTATISNIMGLPCIEPLFKNLFTKSNLSGSFIVLNQHLVRDLKKYNLWNDDTIDQLKYHDGELEHIPEIPEELKAKYQTAFGVSHEYIVEAAAHRQVDRPVSVCKSLPCRA